MLEEKIQRKTKKDKRMFTENLSIAEFLRTINDALEDLDKYKNSVISWPGYCRYKKY
jgi:hypothetical protein